ncbi:membrane-bound alkaline phosphatase-like [Adelges cooleyi]|uniref:membrane-bound alkaline phosphatase-like n=1 Tax=Adelges cooleyi TaxID=133065 RepID=UPI00217F592B|nr:membrane-bound alkaline phosphatase-like [Adelges cooleyi]
MVSNSVMWSYGFCILVGALLVGAEVNAAIEVNVPIDSVAQRESDAKYWVEAGKKNVAEKSKLALRTNTAKNLIMFLGDGMSLTTLTAARIYKGQLINYTGESDNLSFEHFPFTGIAKTYCVDMQVADSACTATAYLAGVKNNLGTIGVSSKVKQYDCPASVIDDNPDSIMKWAQWAGKATGIVTTTRVTHASPAGAFAHTANRDWESDADMLKHQNITNITQCEDIAKQLVTRDPGRNFKVIMGGGRNKFLLKNGKTAERSDVDLVVQWKEDKKERFENENAVYMTNREELMTTDTSNVDHLLGLFHDDHLDFRLKSDVVKQPTLQEMTSKAIQVLQREKNGFVLFVEGGLIDKGHHATYAKIALDETVELSKAVTAAVKLTSEDDTLIVVTSDHAHTMSMAGYPARGSNILGTSGSLAKDNMPYTTLSYANGPQSNNEPTDCRRMNMTNVDFDNVDLRYPKLVPLKDETHGGDDVMVFARGPWAHLFTGNYEQNTIPLAMAMAAGISTDPPQNSAFSLNHHSNSVVGAFIFFYFLVRHTVDFI